MQSIKIPNMCHSWNISQKLLLNKFFAENMYPKKNAIAEYARKLGVSVDKVKLWFKGKRSRMSSKVWKHGMLRIMCQLIIH